MRLSPSQYRAVTDRRPARGVRDRRHRGRGAAHGQRAGVRRLAELQRQPADRRVEQARRDRAGQPAVHRSGERRRDRRRARFVGARATPARSHVVVGRARRWCARPDRARRGDRARRPASGRGTGSPPAVDGARRQRDRARASRRRARRRRTPRHRLTGRPVRSPSPSPRARRSRSSPARSSRVPARMPATRTCGASGSTSRPSLGSTG